MPTVKCPNCGRERLVVEGKKKKCRKCGTPLSAITGYSATEGPSDPLAAEPVLATQVDDTIDDSVDETVEETVDELEMAELDTMTRRELIGYAAENGIEIDKKARKKKILVAIKDELSKPDQAAAPE